MRMCSLYVLPRANYLSAPGITGFTELKYPSLLEVKLTIYFPLKWFDFMNNAQQSEEQRFPRLRVLEKRAKRALWELAREAHAPVKTGF